MEIERLLMLYAVTKVRKITDNCIITRSIEVPRDPDSFEKSVEKSVASRKLGNDLYSTKNHNQETHEEIWKHYSESIAFAPNDSEDLAIGYANRSVLLLHLRKYEESLKDIKRSLKITKSCALKVELFCREAECFVALQEGKQNSSLGKARYWLNKVENDCESLKLNKVIVKAQQVIKDNIPDFPKKDVKNEMNCDKSSVSISYDNEYGRYLIASRDIQTGEFVYIEKFYVNSVNTSKPYAYCSHCLAISWTLISCDHCAFYMFCGKKCKDEAWKKYHDVECRMKMPNSLHFFTHWVRLSTRAVIMGIKESGSIDGLRALVGKIEKQKEVKTRRYLTIDTFSGNSFKGLFNLCYSLESIPEMNQADKAISIAALLQQLIQNEIMGEDVIFLGSVLLRLFSISRSNAFHVLQMGAGCSQPDETLPKCLSEACCSRGMNISLCTSLINHSCDSNVCKLYTNDGRVAYYAVRPIKKNSQIFDSYYYDYTLAPKTRRECVLMTFFKMNCGCLACEENWPDITNLRIQQKAQYSEPVKKI